MEQSTWSNFAHSATSQLLFVLCRTDRLVKVILQFPAQGHLHLRTALPPSH
jgi:hypothetical protein